MQRPTEVLERLCNAMNQHDLEGFVACFDPDYQSEQPAHPGRGFAGRDQVRKNWATMFEGMPDFHAELLGWAERGDVVWAEWRWRGTRRDGVTLDMRGVTVFGVRDGRIAWGRLYMEESEVAGANIDETVQRIAAGRAAKN